MSRLDRSIRRFCAQRACLDRAVELVADLPGPFLELGLGNGRTYDHLRENRPEREIFAFDREVAAHPDCVPDDGHLFLGDFRDSLPRAAARFRGRVALVHAEFGTADGARDGPVAAFIAARLPGVLAPGGIVVADRDLAFAGAEPLPLPEGVAPGLYFMYRAG